jgi:hypothetical protein
MLSSDSPTISIFQLSPTPLHGFNPWAGFLFPVGAGSSRPTAWGATTPALVYYCDGKEKGQALSCTTFLIKFLR